ncbi:MAG: Ig-like domain-containing protein [Bacilli bacterium]|nr:Ig-like domain-containing protein [Bacilli bacterium]
MKKNFFRISIIFVIILICFLSSCKSCNNKNNTNNDDEQQENNINNNNQQNNPQINVDKLNIELLPNETYELNITLEDADVENIEYNFEVSNVNIVKIENKVITALNVGTATIKISVLNSNAAPVLVNVQVNEPPVPPIIVTEETIDLIIGSSHKIEYHVEPLNVEQSVTFTSLDERIITVDEFGNINAIKSGTTKVIITSVEDENVFLEVNVIVSEPPKPTKIVSEKSLVLIIGTTYQLDYYVEPLNASQDVTFSSADKSIITVDENGVISSHELGETFITIKSKENTSVKLRINVEVVLPDVEKIDSIDELNLGYYETKQLICSVVPSNAVQDVTYMSLDENIVTVDETGNITAIKPGTTKVVVTSVYDETVFKEVIVSVNGTLATSLTSVNNIDLNIGATSYISYELLPSDAFKTIEYVVSDSSALEVNDGILVAKKNGTYKVTLKTIDGSNLETVINVNITGDSIPVLSLSESFEKDTNIGLYESFDPLEGIRIFDAEDGELTNITKVTSNVNECEYGKYKVTYEVSDSDGNELYYERDIEVVWDYSVTFIGHAGSLYGGMNSEEAILYAATVLKYTAIEIDVKQTKDGVFVLSHDDTFAGYNLTDYDWDFLKDVERTGTRGAGVTGLKDTSYTAKLCTLKRYLEICKEYNITAVIELKTSPGISNWTEINAPQSSRMPALIKEIEDTGMINNVIFLGSQYECLAWTRRNGYDFIPCQYLVSSCESETYLNRCIEYNFDISINVSSGSNSIEWIKKYKDAGLKVSTYTFDQYTSYKEIQKWIDKGVDFVTTDWHDPKELNLPK